MYHLDIFSPFLAELPLFNMEDMHINLRILYVVYRNRAQGVEVG
jgi:hypothetical protein